MTNNNLTDSLSKQLTDDQSSWLDAVIDKAGWYPGSGYYWSNRSTTIRLCEALAKKGLLIAKGDDRFTVDADHPEVKARQERNAAREKAKHERLAESQRENDEKWSQHRAHDYAVQALIARHQDEYDALVAKALAQPA